MKPLKKFKYAVVVMATIILGACATDHLEITVPNTEAEAIENPDYAIIEALGFSIEGIVGKSA